MQRRTVLNDMPVRDRLPFWRDVVCTHVYNVSPGGWDNPATFQGYWDVRDSGSFGLADVQSVDRRRIRGPREIGRDGCDVIALQRAIGAPVHFSFAQHDIDLAPGDFSIFALDWQHEVTSPGGIGLRSLEIPREHLAPLVSGGGPRRPLTVRGNSALGGLLAAGMDAAWTHIPQLQPGHGEAVLRNLAGLVALACGASADGQDAARTAGRSARLEQALAYANRHLADPDLSPASAAAALGVSARALHAIFEPTGESFARYVQRRRLEECRAALLADRRRPVIDVALGWGFTSLSTFYRAFRDAFGVTPSEQRSA